MLEICNQVAKRRDCVLNPGEEANPYRSPGPSVFQSEWVPKESMRRWVLAVAVGQGMFGLLHLSCGAYLNFFAINVRLYRNQPIYPIDRESLLVNGMCFAILGLTTVPMFLASFGLIYNRRWAFGLTVAVWLLIVLPCLIFVFVTLAAKNPIQVVIPGSYLLFAFFAIGVLCDGYENPHTLQPAARSEDSSAG